MVNVITELEKRDKELLNEIETLKKQLTEKDKETEENFKLRIWNAVDSVKESERPEIAGTLMTLEQHFWPKDEWVKIQKENGIEKVIFGDQFTFENVVKGFTEWTLTNADSFSFVYDKNKKLEEKNAILEKENAELEKTNHELKEKQEELEVRVEELDDEVWMEREEAEKALDTAMKWRKHQMFETVLKHDAAMGKLLDRIDLLENNLLAKNQEISWKDYLATKELPTLPKQQKKNRLHKLKKLVSKVKEKTKEKFQTFIIQKSK